ncbi:MAG: hypothetical protein J5449_03840 [Oscillospiraceae bacterium]|nr:hypothetical protein [Oscillospiraceae bacterium]
MIKKRFSGSARRARNIIWNAAGRYGFETPFMAFYPNGTPDGYFNMVVGLVEKWLGLSRVWAFFARYGGDRRAEEFDELLWLGLENCVYEKELAERPILERLRKARAEEFFDMQKRLSRQQTEMQSMLVYTQQEARWASVSGRSVLLSPRERRMAEALSFPGVLDAEGVVAAMEAFLLEFFRFVPPSEPAAPKKPGALASLLLRHEHKRRDTLLVRTGTAEGDHPRAVQVTHWGLGRYIGPSAEDEAYIRAVFGENLLAGRELHALENELCCGIDEGCRLWLTAPSAPAAGSGAETRETASAREDAARQHKKNEAFLHEHSRAVQGSIRRLTARIDAVLSSFLRREPEPSRAGRIRPETAYRLPLLGDTRVFLRDGEERESELCVELLLDASQSRMNVQEIIASEAYIIARSLENVHIPVRVLAFRSLRGFTVLERLKDWDEHGCEGVLRYFAGGWNRDALALETVGRLKSDIALQDRQRMLLVLTDASPNDSAPLAATDTLLSREYEGAAAVKAAEDAVRSLRAGGMRVGAVFHGSTAHIENVHQIYGHAYVRIQKAAQLAQGVSELLLMLLRELRE